MLHWFKMRRPGQHRGIPECTSTLNTGAAARRWREATLAAAETAADFAVLLETAFQPDELDAADPFSTLEIQKRMMTALPNSMKAHQMTAEHPNATYEAFHKTLINEQARPKSMPYNKAACDSSSYNYASGRLDHQTYYAALDVEREDCNDLVMDPLFDVWFDAAIITYGWLGGNPDAVSPMARSHIWDWPKHRVADVESEANANDKQLKNGTRSLSKVYTESGEDYEDEAEKQATSNGVTIEQQKQINLLLNLPQHVLPVVAQMLGIEVKPAPQPQQSTREETTDDDQA
jgi:capsid protein